MALYFVQHKHSPETCPAQDPEQGNMLLKHLSPANARSYVIKLVADAVLDGKHTFNLILEADQAAAIEKFMEPFQQAGTVEINPASHCEKVVEREGC